MKLELSGKNAVVCGSSQGIGKAIAFELAKHGANITMIARNEAALEENLIALVNDGNQKHEFISMDFDDLELVKARLNALHDRPYHILINNTGGPAHGLIHEAREEDFLIAFKRHVIVSQMFSKELLESMKQANYGRIINIISISVKQPIPGLGVSNTIRAAMASWAKSLSNEVGQWGITVNNLLPGYTKTQRLDDVIEDRAQTHETSTDVIRAKLVESIPLKRFAEVEDIAYVAAFLASPVASYITGINLPVDGGRTSSL